MIVLASTGLAQTPGTPCDDGVPCTTGDVIGIDCLCSGTPVMCFDPDPCVFSACDPATGDCVDFPFPDSDGDGICDPQDECPDRFGQIGGSCDDGQACTQGDTITPACDCIGTMIFCENTDPCLRTDCDPNTGDCESLPFPDSDGDGICDPSDNCPGLPGVQGGPCDDGQACT